MNCRGGGPAWRSALPLAAVLALLALASPALGHAQFVSSSPSANAILPEPPASVQVVLSETVEPATARINVSNATGAGFVAGATRIGAADGRVMQADLAGVQACSYSVRWSAVSAVDGHHSDGSFAFLVQKSDGSLCGALPGATQSVQAPPAPVEVILRFAAFLTLAAFVGAAGLATLAVDPTLRVLKGPSREPSLRAMRLLVRYTGAQAAAYGAFAGAWAAYAVLNAPDGASSSFVQSLAVRAALGGAAAAILLGGPRFSRGLEDGARRRTLLAGALALAAGALALTSMSSHAAADVEWKPIGAAFDFLHLSAASFWVGALLGLLLLRRDLASVPRLARGVLTRFSRLALYAVGGVVVGGLLLLRVQVGGVDGLLASTYGLLVLVMALLLIPMAALGAHNRFWSVPALPEAGDIASEAARSIARKVRLEASAGIAVMAVVAIVTAIAPSAPPASLPSNFTLDDRDGDLRVNFECRPYPAAIGNYSFQFQVFGASSGLPDNSTTKAMMTLRLLNSTLPEQQVALAGPHGNHYFTDPEQVIGELGTWRIDVAFIRPGYADVRVTFNIVISGEAS